MHQLKVGIGAALIAVSILAIYGAVNGYYQRCLSPTAGMGPAIDICPYLESGFYLSLIIFVPIIAIGIWIIIRGAKELSLSPLGSKKA